MKQWEWKNMGVVGGPHPSQRENPEEANGVSK